MKKLLLFTVLLNASFVYAGTNDNECKEAIFIEKLECLANKLVVAEEKLDLVLESAKKERIDDSLFITGFDNAQERWKESFKSDCGSLYDRWRYSSIKNVKWLQCKIELTKQRIHFISKHFVKEAKDAQSNASFTN